MPKKGSSKYGDYDYRGSGTNSKVRCYGQSLDPSCDASADVLIVAIGHWGIDCRQQH